MSNVHFTELTSGTFESFDSTPIYYELRGKGEPMIFIYGIACLINHWHYQIEHFSQNYQTIAFDLRGHHKSNPLVNDENLTLDDLAKDIIGLIEHLGFSKVHFWGHSFGVPVMLACFRLRPDLFASMILINGFAKNPIKNMFGLNAVEPLYHFINNQFLSSPELYSSLWRTAVDNPLSMYLTGFAGGFNLKLTHFKDVEIYARGVAHMELSVFLKLFGELMNFDGSEILQSINVPALIISGEKDNVTPKSYQTQLKENISGSTFVTVPYGSHCTQLDFPDYINLKVESFLKHKKKREK